MNEKVQKKKLSHLEYKLQTWSIGSYFNMFPAHYSSLIFKFRTFMLPIAGNFVSSSISDVSVLCPKCFIMPDTQEHFCLCVAYESPPVNGEHFYRIDDLTHESVNALVGRLIERGEKV